MAARQLPERPVPRSVSSEHLEHRVGFLGLDRLLRCPSQIAERLVMFALSEDHQRRPLVRELELQRELLFRIPQLLIEGQQLVSGNVLPSRSGLRVCDLGSTRRRWGVADQ